MTPLLNWVSTVYSYYVSFHFRMVTISCYPLFKKFDSLIVTFTSMCVYRQVSGFTSVCTGFYRLQFYNLYWLILFLFQSQKCCHDDSKWIPEASHPSQQGYCQTPPRTSRVIAGSRARLIGHNAHSCYARPGTQRAFKGHAPQHQGVIRQNIATWSSRCTAAHTLRPWSGCFPGPLLSVSPTCFVQRFWLSLFPYSLIRQQTPATPPSRKAPLSPSPDNADRTWGGCHLLPPPGPTPSNILFGQAVKVSVGHTDKILIKGELNIWLKRRSGANNAFVLKSVVLQLLTYIHASLQCFSV